jgi:hypothetical protein
VNFHQHRFERIENSAREIRESVLEMASPIMRESQSAIQERITQTRVRTRVRPERSIEEEQVLTDILVAREIARVDLGVDVLVAQPRSP